MTTATPHLRSQNRNTRSSRRRWRAACWLVLAAAAVVMIASARVMLQLLDAGQRLEGYAAGGIGLAAFLVAIVAEDLRDEQRG